MEFKVGHVTARCVACAATVFDEQRPGSGRMQSRFRCVRCGVEMSYSEIIVQIGSTSRRARERTGGARVAEAAIPGLISK